MIAKKHNESQEKNIRYRTDDSQYLIRVKAAEPALYTIIRIWAIR